MPPRLPWWCAQSDFQPTGEPELQRHCRDETHIGFVVHGSIDTDLVLGILAVRCARGGPNRWFPMGLAISDTLIDMEEDAFLPSQQNPIRHEQADGFSEGDDGA